MYWGGQARSKAEAPNRPAEANQHQHQHPSSTQLLPGTVPGTARAAAGNGSERTLSIRELLNSSSDENDDKEAKGSVSAWRAGPHSAPGPGHGQLGDELAGAAKPRHTGAPYQHQVIAERQGQEQWRAQGMDQLAEAGSAVYGVRLPQAANPSKMATASQIPGDRVPHEHGNRPHFGHSHSAQMVGYSAARPAQLVARTNGDGAAGGEVRYRPYPEIMAMSAPAANRLLLARAVSEALDPAGGSADKGRRGGDGKRRRRTQACEYCHLKKVKCEGDGARCINCIKNDVQCIWGQKRKRGPKPKSGLSMTVRAPRSTHKAEPREPAGGVRSAAAAAVSMSPLAAGSPQADEAESSVDGSAAAAAGTEDAAAGMARSSHAQPEGIRMPRLDREMNDFFTDKVAADTREAIRFYFDYFYPLSPMFHPSMFIRRVVHGQVDPLLIDAMKATTARVITQKTGRFVDGRALARSVKQRILEQLEQPTVDLIRTIVAMTLLAGSQGEYVSYNSLICLAASLVVRLGWHKLDLYKRPPPASWDEWVSLEVKRRLFWLVYQIDSYQAMLTGRPMTIAEDSVYVSAPCSDYEWDAMHINRRTVPSRAPDSQRPRSNGRGSHQRSSRSSSGSASSLVQSMRVNQHEIVATGAFSYSFMALCELTAIIARINIFLCDAKASRPSLLTASMQNSQSALSQNMPFPAVDFMAPSPETGSLVYPVLRTVNLLSEYPAFVELDERLEEWKRNLLMPEELRDDSAEPGDISYFGTADHRRFMMRVRYFCLHCYYVPITIFLHQSNRPSFFTEYEQPLEQRMARRTTPASPETAGDDVPVEASVTSEDISAMESDRALREMLNAAFADTWNEGILAYDVEPQSWNICVAASKGLSEHLQRNSDFPLERFDQVIPFCIFMSVSVLIRQVRMCSRMLLAAASPANPDADAQRQRRLLEAAGGYAAVAAERSQCVRYIKHQWSTLQSLGALWDIDGMKMLLKSMQIDEVANAADLFSNMSL
ncbi:hypothetical protein LPJ78_004548 [Coemansia sp. RSA 989]|nr:hypothetical protein LPJ68_003995 [Coemansia sp. RSA 1086]KAJ1862713.1 hypothetical protein LPJ78_004548 [Coemansia sp. RSA 989]KAJ1874562.1 hypothetical protein LPJ55_001422 [Coemansia sp. RSA 990]